MITAHEAKILRSGRRAMGRLAGNYSTSYPRGRITCFGLRKHPDMLPKLQRRLSTTPFGSFPLNILAVNHHEIHRSGTVSGSMCVPSQVQGRDQDLACSRQRQTFRKSPLSSCAYESSYFQPQHAKPSTRPQLQACSTSRSEMAPSFRTCVGRHALIDTSNILRWNQ